MKTKRFCHYCGHSLEERFLEKRRRLFCARCDDPIYENPVPATCLIVSDIEKNVLLVKRSVEPKIGGWCLPGGFIELGEAPHASALRELQEETGLSGRIDHIVDVIAHPNPFYDTVLIVCYAVTHFSGRLMAGDDASEAAFFSLPTLPEIAFKSHEHLINTFFNRPTQFF